LDTCRDTGQNWHNIQILRTLDLGKLNPITAFQP
jgi:hypothetical protein